MFDIPSTGTMVEEPSPDHPGEWAAPGEAPLGEERQRIPAELDSWEPGPVLGALLGAIDPGALSAEDRLMLLRAAWRQVAWAQAVFYRALGSIPEAYREALAREGETDEELVQEAAGAEVQAALRLTRQAASRELSLAEVLRSRLPALAGALVRGLIDRPRALVMARETAHLSLAEARQVVGEVLGRAAGLTTGQLGAELRRLALEVRPREAEERFREARQERRVVVEPTSEGTAHLMVLHLAPDEAQAAASRIDRLARHLQTEGETRSMDQLRADVASDLLSGRGGRGVEARVEVRVDLETLAGLADRPGDLAGYGPVVAEVARRVAREARSWSYAVTDPVSGEVLATGVLRRRPTARVARAVRARYPTCVFPGCRMPARDCDLDHRRPYAAGGCTHEVNLAPLCRRHHHLRHRLGWSYLPTSDGDHVWRSPLGRTYTTSGRDP